ncbi:unnamed protein product [Leptidea sinapis]|uniref:C2H2-type domain-containing protein n=1 Tax=Leptidea sinapis TaxID=189913 RepID=A0A5E4QYG6_9NEOP|nr:unnamed protein product [Leptidea sinapis]
MKEHFARYHAGDRPATTCPVQDCNHTVTNASSLYAHMKKVHANEDRKLLKAALSKHKEIRKKLRDNLMVDSLWENPTAEIVADEEVPANPTEMPEETELSDAKLCLPSDLSDSGRGRIEVKEELLNVVRLDDGHSARTHCTWPLQKVSKDCAESYELEDYVLKIEEFEGSDSNTYMVRSDLFLHGNVSHNDDSREMCEAEEGEETGARGLLLADLPLDAPSVDLDQLTKQRSEYFYSAVKISHYKTVLHNEVLYLSGNIVNSFSNTHR